MNTLPRQGGSAAFVDNELIEDDGVHIWIRGIDLFACAVE